jgi:FAS-associated factor 2
MANSEFDLTSLTEEQQLALQQFTSVTDQELEAAVPLLQKCQWNAQIAITRFFDGDAETIDPAAEAARAPPPAQDARRTETLMEGFPSRGSSLSRRVEGLEPAPRVVPTPESQLSQPVPFPLSMLLLPFNITYVIIQRISGTIGYLFPFIPRLLQRFYSGRALQPSRDAGRRPLNPRDTAARFIRELDEDHGLAQGTLPFHVGSYADAYDRAKREPKFLMVVLVSPEHDETPKFVRDTLMDPTFIDWVKDPASNIILWGGSVRDPEPYQVASALGATEFPWISLIVHTPSVSSTAMSKIATFSGGAWTTADLIANMQTAMAKRNEELERVRSQRREQEASRSLRQEQESAYERSLAQDREKKRRREEEKAAQEKGELEQREREQQKAEQARKLLQWRRWRAQKVQDEPGLDVKDAVRISIRMPDGERVVRRFRPDEHIEDLYAFVECHDVLEEMKESEKRVEKPRDYDHTYGFQLVSPMPREVFEVEKDGLLRDRIGRSGNLIVEKTTEDDEEDEKEEAQ